MKPANLVIRGQKLENPGVTDLPDQLQLEEVYVLSASTRGAGEMHTLRLDENNVAEFVFDDKTTWLTGSDGLEELFPEIAIKKRADEPFEIPPTLANTSEQRGIADIAITMVRIFSKKKLRKGVLRLAEEFEQKNLDSKVGLFRVDSNFQLQPLNPFEQGKPYLLFLHGTASSTAGSFAGMKGTELWRFICQSYDDNILAFQHESITKSPLQNVRDLVGLLPHDITLHIISHSRGGLVGDVLVRFSGSNVQSRGFSQEELSVLKKARRNDDIQCIAEIEKNLSGKNISIEKFIRVACPAGGTILASGRLEIYFNIIANLTGLVTGLMGAPVYLAMKNLIAEIIDTKDDPEVLSGIEAMNPESPFIKILNNPSTVAAVDSALTVVSGNCGVNFSLRALKIIAVRLFFLETNDLVVNSRSMYLGAKRKEKIQYFYDDSDDVDHFHYFSNRKTGNAIQLALQAGAGTTVPGFTSADQLSSDIASRNAILHPEGGELKAGVVTGKRPIVVLLPGIMGSNIGRDDDLVWINYAGFMQGGLTELKHMDLYTSTSLVRTSYEKLKLFLEQYYDVEAWHYDWRQQLSTMAEKLNARILELLDHNQPIKIIGHSMGGVLVRDFIVNHRDTWQKLNQSRGFRLLFLGAPLGGSYRIPYVLLGLDPIIRKLSLLDFRHDKRQLVEMFSQMEGLLSLLPLNGEPDFAQIETWQRLCKASGNNDWPVPSPALLQRFREHRERIKLLLKDSDFENATYIAGKDKATPSGCNLDDPENPMFLSTAEGDQSVTWDSGIPKVMEERGQVYYVDVSHGSLAANTRLFKGIADILEMGSTELFSMKRPAVRSDSKVFRTPDVYDFDLSVRGLENTILGFGEEARMEIGETPLQVFVSNGDLGFASFPVIAGHFINDGILNGERAIDYYLKWALTERHQLGLYPGEIGTSEIFLTKGSTFKGGIIIGLGHLGSLTAYQLSRSVESATLKYLLDLRNNDNSKESRPGIGLSALAIGCGYGGLTVESSLRAILQGIQNANNKMKQLHAENALAVDTVEVVEQYEDKALDCFYALNAIEREEDQTLNIITTKKKYKTIFGSRRRLPTDNNEEWWTRIHVQPREQGLRFNISTGGAREEQRDLLTSREIIQELVEEFSVNNRWTVKLAKTIFELLVPNDFKEQLKKKSNIAWIVDKDTASYPWELLQDSLNNAKPLSINAGMVRQLATQDYRINSTVVPKNNALVIADPELSGFVGQLPGALKEGEKVGQILKENGFEITSILRGHHNEIIQGLFSNEYKIIHLAGHGVFNEKEPDKSGMVIGKNVFLKTRDVAQMSTLPELVFVNCCYLGQMNTIAEEYYQKRYRLAANIGTQLIENGVKAVIVAGWAVDDQAALEFTEVFYECMFDGYTFGKAVQRAREVIYNKYPRTNTWGAYQCYGDQYFQLERKVRKQKKKDYVIAIEAEIELNNLLNKTEIPGYSPEELEKELDLITEAVDRSGIRNGIITEREALIYYSLGDYDNAISRYESLLPMENASFSFSAMEKYCNMRARQVVSRFRKGSEPIDELKVQIDKVIRDLENLLSYGETSERLSVLASAYKRKATLGNMDERLEACSKAAYYYYNASNGKYQSLYALSNWLQMESLLVLHDKRKWGDEISFATGSYRLPALPDAVAGIEKKLELLAMEFDSNMNYWEMSNEANLMLSLLLMNPVQSFDDVMKAYIQVWQNAGSKGQKTSELEHFEFLTDSLADSISERSKPLAARLESLKHACVSMK